MLGYASHQVVSGLTGAASELIVTNFQVRYAVQDPCLQRTASVARPQAVGHSARLSNSSQTLRPPGPVLRPAPLTAKPPLACLQDGLAFAMRAQLCANATPEAGLPRHGPAQAPETRPCLPRSCCLCVKILRPACMHDPREYYMQFLSILISGAAAHRLLSIACCL